MGTRTCLQCLGRGTSLELDVSVNGGPPERIIETCPSCRGAGERPAVLGRFVAAVLCVFLWLAFMAGIWLL